MNVVNVVMCMNVGQGVPASYWSSFRLMKLIKIQPFLVNWASMLAVVLDHLLLELRGLSYR